MVRIANAPVSYGAFEVTVGHDDDVPGADAVLDAVAAAGYEGIDLGPLGYLGLGPELASALGARNLLLTGGYVEVDVSSDDAPAAGLAELDRVCDQFDTVSGGVEKAFLPRPTVAIVAAEKREPTGSVAARWVRINRTIDTVVKRCRARGYEPCLHNEIGTQIATPASIELVLETTAASLCLDTGHLVAAGGDPSGFVKQWHNRIDHVHLKDALTIPSEMPYVEAMTLWKDNVFCRLGVGNAGVDAVLAALRAQAYEGWIVVEQDVLPSEASGYARAAADQVANRRFLADRGW